MAGVKRKARKPITFPVLDVRMVASHKVVANSYNPNAVAPVEMELLAVSIEEDGFTQPVVTCYDPARDEYIVVDGFHRYTILVHWFELPEIPVVVINKDIGQRMAATVRHNRARGKHTVDLMAELVVGLVRKGWKDTEIAKHLGMDGEELLRLKAQTGYAELFAKREYSRSWEEIPDTDMQVGKEEGHPSLDEDGDADSE